MVCPYDILTTSNIIDMGLLGYSILNRKCSLIRFWIGVEVVFWYKNLAYLMW
jgi:hypothetical protein